MALLKFIRICKDYLSNLRLLLCGNNFFLPIQWWKIIHYVVGVYNSVRLILDSQVDAYAKQVWNAVVGVIFDSFFTAALYITGINNVFPIGNQT